ncbi:MAG: thermonuclease family protein [Ginsengibacter sp.]
MKRLLFCIILLLLSIINISCDSGNSHEGDNAANDYLAVREIVDGDTFWVENGLKKVEKIRLIGIDAPESRRTGRKEIGYFGKEAKQYVTELLKGKRVKLEFDVGRYDRYHRTLAYVYLEDGTFLNAELVKEGYAVILTVPPNVKYAKLFVKLQQEARKNDRGLWNKNVDK